MPSSSESSRRTESSVTMPIRISDSRLNSLYSQLESQRASIDDAKVLELLAAVARQVNECLLVVEALEVQRNACAVGRARTEVVVKFHEMRL